jgi:hypothetical protein
MHCPKEEQTMTQTISKETLGWLAGIIDGEGSIQLEKASSGLHSYRATLSIGNNDVRMIQRVSEVFVQLGLTFCYTINLKHNHAIYIRCTGFKSVERVLREIRPYLVSKTDQADVLLGFIEERKTLLNSTGKVMPEHLDRYIGMQQRAVETLHTMHTRKWNLQRLQRSASRVLRIPDAT